MMNCSTCIFTSLSKKAPEVAHFFVKNKKIKFCLCGEICGRGGLYGIHREGRKFGGLGLKGHSDGSSVRNILKVHLMNS